MASDARVLTINYQPLTLCLLLLFLLLLYHNPSLSCSSATTFSTTTSSSSSAFFPASFNFFYVYPFHHLSSDLFTSPKISQNFRLICILEKRVLTCFRNSSATNEIAHPKQPMTVSSGFIFSLFVVRQ